MQVRFNILKSCTTNGVRREVEIKKYIYDNTAIWEVSLELRCSAWCTHHSWWKKKLAVQNGICRWEHKDRVSNTVTQNHTILTYLAAGIYYIAFYFFWMSLLILIHVHSLFWNSISMPVELQSWDWLNWLNWLNQNTYKLSCNLNTICFCFNNDRWRFTLVPFFGTWYKKKKKQIHDMIFQQNFSCIFHSNCGASTSKRLIAVFVLCASLISRHWTCTLTLKRAGKNFLPSSERTF